MPDANLHTLGILHNLANFFKWTFKVSSHFHYPLFNRCGLFQLLAIFINVMLRTFFYLFLFFK